MSFFISIFLAFGTINVMASIEKINQINYLQSLQQSRPDLVEAACKENLILKPVYRTKVLAHRQSYESIISEKYSLELRNKDIIWASRFRSQAIKITQKINN